MRTLLAPAVLALSISAAPVWAAQTYGLVIGVDEYAHIPDLEGAVNDAVDIADALGGLNADVTTLLNTAASRDAILSAWRTIATGMQEGDQLVVSFAGHGSNEPEHYAGNEADGRDETLLLSGFSPYGEGAGERIRDDEIAKLIALSPPNSVIFIADACHSGTLSRSIKPALGYRYFAHGKLENDPLPPPPPRTPVADGREDVTLFLAAVDDSEKVPEFLIDGKPRGALSYSFASGLRGGADANGDRALTKGEIEEYVRRKVRSVSQGFQSPQVAPAGQTDTVVFALDRGVDRVPASDIFAMPFEDLPVLTVSHNGGAAGALLLEGVDGIALQPEGAAADMMIDLRDGDIRSMVGDVIRDVGAVPPEKFSEVIQITVDKMRVAAALQAAAGTSALQIRFGDGDRNYKADEILDVAVKGRATPHVALFNIASTGGLSLLYPIRDATAGIMDPATLPAAQDLALSLQITPPFGADHVVAFQTETDPAALLELLNGADGTTDIRAFWDGLRTRLGPQASPQVAVFPFHSVPD